MRNDIPPEDDKYHQCGSHVICENGHPIIRATLWNCIRRIREMEHGMTRMYEHSPFTILPFSPEQNFRIPSWEVINEV